MITITFVSLGRKNHNRVVALTRERQGGSTHHADLGGFHKSTKNMEIEKKEGRDVIALGRKNVSRWGRVAPETAAKIGAWKCDPNIKNSTLTWCSNVRNARRTPCGNCYLR